jgi:hypothetical protein
MYKNTFRSTTLISAVSLFFSFQIHLLWLQKRSKHFRRNANYQFCIIALSLFLIGPQGYGQTPPNFGAASNFSLFSSTGAVGNTSTSSIYGNIGANSGAITGFELPSIVTGTIYQSDAITALAAADLLIAYTELSNMTVTNSSHSSVFGNNETLIAGVYSIGAAGSIVGNLTLDAQGNSDALFIFRIGGSLTSAAASSVHLINGALPSHIFWVTEGAIALDASTQMSGTLLAHNGAVSMDAGSTLLGRMYSTTGAVTINNTIVTDFGGTIASPQTICVGTQPSDLILSGNTGTIIKWQKAFNTSFSAPIDIANTSNTLTGAMIGNLTTNTYFRAAVTDGSLGSIMTSYITVSINADNSFSFGAATNFALFTSAGAVSNAGISNITGAIGTVSGAITGFESPTVLNGLLFQSDAITAQAALDLQHVSNQLRNVPNTNTHHAPAFGGGETVYAGVYNIGGAGSVSGTLTLDGQGNPNAIFIFKFGGAFSTSASTTILLSNSANAENVFWVSEGAIAMAASTTMVGTLIANNGAASMGDGGNLHGRLFSTTGAVSIYNTTVIAVGNRVTGLVSSNQILCHGATPSEIKITGNSTSLLKWQKATDTGFTNPIDIASTSTTLSPILMGATSATTYFRAVQVHQLCGFINSNTIEVALLSEVQTGYVSSNQTICKGTMPSTLYLAGNSENVIQWEASSNESFTDDFAAILSTSSTLTGASIGVLQSSRFYRAQIENGSCGLLYTLPIKITVPATLTYSNGIWDGIPSNKTAIIVSSNLDLISNLHVCSCQVTAGAILSIPSGVTLIVEKSLVVDPLATLVVANNGSLVQVDDSATAMGSISVSRNTQSMKQYDYSYWSSPVQNWRLIDLSPNTLSDKFHSFNPLTNNWNTINGGNQIMTPGQGYIIRAPQGWSNTNASLGVYEGSFIGTPNTGIIPVSIQKGDGTLNLIGNPYPSAIDIDAFLTDPENSNIVNGTIYLWTHTTAISSAIPGDDTYNYSSDDYAKYNLTGGVKTISSALGNAMIPDGKIASGQGFFIEAKSDLIPGTYTAHFNNSMRVVGINDNFFRLSNNSVTDPTIAKNRLWLSLSNVQGAYNEMLLGYVPGATNSYDALYDGKILPAGNSVALYTISDTDQYAIQGRSLPFDESDVVTLGYTSSIGGVFSIGIENRDGLFQNKNVYLIDHLTNTTQNLNEGAYSFSTTIGTFNNRFELRYTNALGSTLPGLIPLSPIIYVHNQELIVSSVGNIISKVEIFNSIGQLLLVKNNNTRSDVHLFPNTSNQVLVVKVTSDTNQVTVKKTLF